MLHKHKEFFASIWEIFAGMRIGKLLMFNIYKNITSQIIGIKLAHILSDIRGETR